MPGSKVWSYSPVNGASVPFSRSTRYCSGESSARHCSSVFWTFVIVLLFRDSSLQSCWRTEHYATEGWRSRPGRPILAPRGGAQMKEAVVLMRFLRRDPVGQRFGVAVLV